LDNSIGTRKIGFGSVFDEEELEEMDYLGEQSELTCESNCDENSPMCPE
jgi:hypothetical protein